MSQIPPQACSGRGTIRNEQVALSPGQGWTVRGTVHLLMVEGFLPSPKNPPTALRAVPLPAKAREEFSALAPPFIPTSAPPRKRASWVRFSKRETELMAKLYLAALIALSAASVHAQSPKVSIEPSPDSAEQRKGLQKLTACLAEARPRWARNTLSRPYLSEAQAYDASQALRGRDGCAMDREGVEVTFRTSGMVGSLAEHYLREEIDRADAARVAEKLSTLPPLNVTEDFALCVASRDPASARALALSEPGSAAEDEAARKVAANLESCTQDNEKLTVDLQSLRSLVATALYRGVTAVLGS